MKKRILLSAVVSSAFICSPTVAAVAGAASDTATIDVGNSVPIPFGPHAGWGFEPGIGVQGVSLGMKIPMRSLIELVTDPEQIQKYGQYGEVDSNNVAIIVPPEHGKTQMGKYNFAELPTNSAEVYYGEWTAYDDTTGATRSVYYVGKDRTTNMPTSGTATYAVKGINQYNGSNQLSGTFTADFGSNKLNGSIANNALTVAVNANINTSAASFNGTATAAGQTGSSQGHFFGSNAASLAGFAKFNNRNLDTAFGGVKQ